MLHQSAKSWGIVGVYPTLKLSQKPKTWMSYSPHAIPTLWDHVLKMEDPKVIKGFNVKMVIHNLDDKMGYSHKCDLGNLHMTSILFRKKISESFLAWSQPTTTKATSPVQVLTAPHPRWKPKL